MLRINSNDQGHTAVFEIAPEDRHRVGLDVPKTVCLTIDDDTFTGSPVEAFAGRWLVIAGTLTGLSYAAIEAEGFEVRKYMPGGWVVRPIPPGTVFLGSSS